ncbi:MAG: hypothetical protein M3347_01295, partial [Armatimonadota bacterium]|nr:hypothetical protein [Armatimonadota bacterium]
MPHRAWLSGFILPLLLINLAAPALAQPLEGTGVVSPLGWNADAQGRFILCLIADAAGRIWVGTEDQGVWRYDANTPEARRWTHFTTQEGLGDNNAYALATDQQGRVWAGHLNHGVSVWNGQAWKNYGVLDGPLGERVFAIAVCPTDGDVWLATSAGLTRYSVRQDTWSYYTRAEGLPSDQVSDIAFDATGNLYAGTQCDGIALAGAADDYKTWRTVTGPARMPNTPAGSGLPSNLINDVLVARDGTIYAATPCGLARSADGGKTWRFVRGEDWEANVKGLYRGPQPKDVEIPGDLLLEDWVTCLAQDRSGMLWIGYRQKGFEVRDPNSDQRAFSSVGELVENSNDYVRALLVPPRMPPLIGYYGDTAGGLQTMRTLRRTTGGDEVAPVAQTGRVAPFPSPAQPPGSRELAALRQRVQATSQSFTPGTGAYLGEDWLTWGDWVGRYGREYAALCGMAGPGNHYFGWDASYQTKIEAGPHSVGENYVYHWIQWLRTDNPKVLYNPVLGTRRQGEVNDGSYDRERYPFSYEGPDLWVTVEVPA